MGIGTDQGEPYEINPVAKMHKQQGTYPKPEDIEEEINEAKLALEKAGVEVLQPDNLKEKKQIFTRDIGFVIDDRFVIANMKEPLRQGEIKGIDLAKLPLAEGPGIAWTVDSALEVLGDSETLHSRSFSNGKKMGTKNLILFHQKKPYFLLFFLMGNHNLILLTSLGLLRFLLPLNHQMIFLYLA